MRYVLAWLAAGLLYLGLAGQTSSSELLSGAGTAALCIAWSTLLRRHSEQRFSAGVAHLAPWGRCLRQLLPEALKTAAVLWRALWHGAPVGALRPEHFVPGTGTSSATHARRASALLCASLARARFIVRLEPSQARALSHELYRRQQENGNADAEERWLT